MTGTIRLESLVWEVRLVWAVSLCLSARVVVPVSNWRCRSGPGRSVVCEKASQVDALCRRLRWGGEKGAVEDLLLFDGPGARSSLGLTAIVQQETLL